MTAPQDLFKRLHAAAKAANNEPAYLGALSVQEVDRKRASAMADARRLFNEEADKPWGLQGERHRGDEATQAKTWQDGCLGEAVLGRVLRSLNSRNIRLSAPLEWNPSTDPDLIYTGTATFRADFKSANYKRADGKTSWSINHGTHHRCDVDGYVAADLADGDTVHVWYYAKPAVEKVGDLLERTSKTGKPSKFYRLFFPKSPV